MKATGVVRRIDDLGRIVIPIEIRRTMRIRDGDPLEIFVDKDGEVILKKYSAIVDLGTFAEEMTDSLHEASGQVALISDRDSIVAVSGARRKDFIDKRVSDVVLRSMNDRQTLFHNDPAQPSEILLEEGEESEFSTQVIAPIIVHGDPYGTVILASVDRDNPIGDTERKMAQSAAGFLSRYLSE
ncbi:MAG: stage V sporulation T C-terminal domain-containing protein [Bacillota bacterium]